MSEQLPSPVRPLPSYLPQMASGAETFGAAVPSDSEVRVREYWRLLMKYRFLIVSVTVIAVLLSLIYAFTATPIYSAQARLRISTYEPILSSTKIEDMLSEKSRAANYLETQVHELTSLALGDRVLDDPQMRDLFVQWSGDASLADLANHKLDTPGLVGAGAAYRVPVALIQAYLQSIRIQPIKRTSHVLVEAQSRSPDAAAVFANRHASQYIEFVRSERINQQSSGLKFLRARADELRERVAGIEREMADYAEINSIVAVNKDENITVQKMSQLNRLLTEAIAQSIQAENLYKEAESNLGASSAGFDDPSVQNLRSELVKKEAEYAQLGEKFLPSYPRMVQLKSQIEQLKSAIGAQRKQIIAGLQARSIAAKQEEERLREELDRQKSQTFELSKKQVQYNMLSRDLTTSRELLENVLKQIQETTLAVESNASNVTVVDFAAVPDRPTYPRKRLIVMVGSLIGLLVGIGLAFFFSYLDNTVRTPEDIARYTGLPSLGLIPSFESEREVAALQAGPGPRAPPSAASIGENDAAPNGLPAVSSGIDLPIMYLSSPKSLVAEAYRTVRTGLLLSQAGEPPRTLLVTSAQSSEGKTTSAVNLAASLASSGSRVVLIDADLRRPSLHKYFHREMESSGLVEVLAGQCAIEEIWHDGLVPGVTVVLSGRIPPNPAELLGSVEMAKLLDALAARFDYVVIDSPPILPVTDSVILSRYVDGVVLVVKGAATPKKVVQDAVMRLRAVGARVLGAVLNDVNIAGGDYAYYNRYYYSYYRAEKPGGDARSRAVVDAG